MCYPRLFEAGQEVACIDTASTAESEGAKHFPSPKLHEIVIVDGYDGTYCAGGPSKGHPYIRIKGYVCSFTQDGFAPLMSDAVLEKELESLPSVIYL